MKTDLPQAIHSADSSTYKYSDIYIVNYRSAEFRKSKANNWQSLTGPSKASEDQAAADAIIASAAAETAARAEEDDDAPTIDDPGAQAGLQTAAQVKEQIRRVQAAERKALRDLGEEATKMNQDTIYRDASGRIVNVAMKRAEIRKKAEEEEARKAAELEAAKGDVQRVEKEKRKEELQNAKFLTVARYADDKELNEELKDKERWNDPAAQFLAKKQPGKSVTGRTLYQGNFQPNRYGIRPGHKWDGVDRSNGFEGDWFKARNRQTNLKNLEYAWQMDE